MRDIVTRERMIFRMTDSFRLGIAKEWLQNLKLDSDVKELIGDRVEGRRNEWVFKELFPLEAASVPPTEVFVSCGAAPDLLQVCE